MLNKIELVGVGKSSILDAAIPFVGCFVFFTIHHAIFFHEPNYLYKIFVWAIFEAMIYGIVCYATFVVFIRMFHAPTLFMGVAIALSYHPFLSNIMVEYKMGGVWIYRGGVITPFGIFYEMFNPIGIMAVYSIYVFIKNWKLKKTTISPLEKE